MPVSISGQVAVIVGASSGIGRAAAVLFAREGAKVVAAARREDRLQSLKDELEKEQCAITIKRADASNPDDMQQLAQETLKQFGKIDILVVASGINTPDRSMKRLTPAIWNSLVNVNLDGAFYATHAILPSMRDAGAGHLIYISSISGVQADVSGAAYQASKRGVVGLAHAIRMEEKQNGIRTCVICPVWSIPSYWRKGRSSRRPRNWRRRCRRKMLLRRFCTLRNCRRALLYRN